MTESTPSAGRWRYGVHPRAIGATVRSLGRIDLPIGEALRLEMEVADPSGRDEVHVQLYICTEAGGWALWTSCPASELADREAALHGMIPPVIGEP